MEESRSDKNKGTVFILSLFLGVLGVDRMYVGKIGTGILKLIACFFVVGILWWLIDLIVIATGNFRDGQGRPIR
jgi:TM2 domain-containing membrane protein YozV